VFRNRPLIRGALLVAILAMLAACGAGEWTMPAADTTCDDWRERMSDSERSDMIGPMLLDSMRDVGGDSDLISDDMLTEELRSQAVDQLSRACEVQPGTAMVPAVLRDWMTTQINEIFENVGHELQSP
jgi:hypothetical protein